MGVIWFGDRTHAGDNCTTGLRTAMGEHTRIGRAANRAAGGKYSTTASLRLIRGQFQHQQRHVILMGRRARERRHFLEDAVQGAGPRRTPLMTIATSRSGPNIPVGLHASVTPSV